MTVYEASPVKRGRRMKAELGHGIGWFVWLGSHPVLTLFALAVNLCTVALLLCWVAAVTAGWLLWGAGVSVWWLAAALPFRRHHSRGELRLSNRVCKSLT